MFGWEDWRDCKWKKIFIEVLLSRKPETTKNLFLKKSRKETIVKTDVYLLYLKVCNELDPDHIIVSNNKGLMNFQCFHTNTIKNIWSHLRKFIGNYHGVMRDNVFLFSKELSYNYRYIDRQHFKLVKNAFPELIKGSFN